MHIVVREVLHKPYCILCVYITLYSTVAFMPKRQYASSVYPKAMSHSLFLVVVKKSTKQLTAS